MSIMNLPFVSIVVLNYNGKHLLEDCLTSLSDTNYPKNRYRVILVDNGSQDDSIDYAKKNFPFVDILKIQKNQGFAHGNNIGVKHALKDRKIEYIVVLNNDTKVTKNWLLELVKTVNADNGIGICGPKVLNMDGATQSVGGKLDIFGTPHLITGDKNSPRSKDAFFISGCCMLIKRDIIEKLGYVFDPRYFSYFEDIDLCWRTWLLSYRVVCSYKSRIYHKFSQTISKDVKRGNLYLFHNYKNKILTYRKNLRTPLKELTLIPILLSTLIAIFHWSLKSKWMYGLYVFRYLFSKIDDNKQLRKISLKNQLRVLSLSMA